MVVDRISIPEMNGRVPDEVGAMTPEFSLNVSVAVRVLATRILENALKRRG
jgi:hypothetical protein